MDQEDFDGAQEELPLTSGRVGDDDHFVWIQGSTRGLSLDIKLQEVYH
jgi:hypothetical protein